jgi:hypothetical protein
VGLALQQDGATERRLARLRGMHRRLAYLFVLIGMCALSAARADAPAGSRPTYNIIFVGDSITYGAYDTDRTTQAPPASCKKR